MPLLRRIAAAGVPREVSHEHTSLAALAVDIAGFTELSSTLATRGPEGAERVADIVNGHFGWLIDLIVDHGGQVVTFAGDAIVAVWPADDAGDLARAVQRAAHCGLAMQTEAASRELVDGRRLGLRIGLGAGEAVTLYVMGSERSWRFVVAGPALASLGTALRHAESGDVVLGPVAAQLLPPYAASQSMGDGVTRLVAMPGIAHPDPAVLPTLSDEAMDDVLAFVPEVVADRLATGHANLLSELRTITAMFVTLPDLDVLDERSRRALAMTVETVQRTVDHYDGTLSNLLMDEKGVTFVIAFGLPPRAHEEDAARAVQAAEALQDHLDQAQLSHGIGLATGRAFCGVYGNERHREYTMLGATVNLAARLMQAARNEVLCDQPTMRSTGGRVHFAELAPIEVKGVRGAVSVFRPSWSRDAGMYARERLEASHVDHPIVGRDAERAELSARLGALALGRTSGVVIIEGEAGIGKSRLVADALTNAANLEVTTLVGAGDAVEVNTPYFAWRGVFEQLLGFDTLIDRSERRRSIQARVAGLGEIAEWAPLLNAVVDVGLEENETTRQMSGSGRREATTDLMLRLLADAAADRPLLVVLDDIQWIDALSWSFVGALQRKVSPLLLVLAGRPQRSPPEAYRDLVALAEAAAIRLGPIDAAASVGLAAQRLGVDRLPEPVARLIEAKAEGNPLFSEELAFSLRDSGVIDVEGSTSRLAVEPVALERLELPETIQGVVTSRLDQLTARQQMTAKVASVAGIDFTIELLREVHPLALDPAEVESDLAALEALDLVARRNDRLSFKHAVSREAAYQLLSYQLRRELHEAVAEWFERSEVAETDFALVAHHWEAAGRIDRAVDYLEAAGASAIEKGAAADADHFFSRLLEVERTRAIATVPKQRLAFWWGQRAEANNLQSRLDDAVADHRRALAILGFRLPAGWFGLVIRLLGAIVRQVGHLVIPGFEGRIAKGERRSELRQAALAAAMLGQIFYFQTAILNWATVNLMSINLAERAGDPGIAGIGYSGLGNLVGTMRLHRIAQRYFTRARLEEVEPAYAGQTGEVAARLHSELWPRNTITADFAEAVYLMTVRRDAWDRAIPMLEDAVAWARRLGGRDAIGAGLGILGFARSVVSPLDVALAELNALVRLGLESTQAQHATWGLTMTVPCLLERGDVAEAKRVSDRADIVVADADELSRPIHHAVRAQALARSDDWESAVVEAQRALDTFQDAPIFLFLVGYTGLSEALLATLASRAADDPSTRKRLRRMLRSALRRWGRFALVLPVARPRLRLFRALADLERGRLRRAGRGLEKALGDARRHGLPWDVARCHLELAHLASLGFADRHDHLHRARLEYTRLGAHARLDEIAMFD